MSLFTEISPVILQAALLIWLWLAPSKTIITYGLQVLGVGLALMAIALTTLPGILPWWTNYAFAFLWIAAVIHRLVNYGLKSYQALPSGVEWIPFVFSSALVIAGGALSITAIEGRQMPEGDFVELAAPFSAGRYIVANGGSKELINAHQHFYDARNPNYQLWRGTGYAIDFVKSDRLGFHKFGTGSSDPEDYDIYGTAILAPCDGEVIASEDGRSDNLVGNMDTENKAGNHVILTCNGNDILLAHMKSGSVKVSEGDRVATGDEIGLVGNSGQSGEPHLHMHAQTRGYPGRTFSGTPLPMKIDGRFLVRNDVLRVSDE